MKEADARDIVVAVTGASGAVYAARLLRAEMRHKLREAEAKDMMERDLPRQQEELEAKLVEAQVALANVKRRLEKQALERADALRNLDHDDAVAERDARSLDEEQLLLDKDRDTWARDGSPAGSRT